MTVKTKGLIVIVSALIVYAAYESFYPHKFQLLVVNHSPFIIDSISISGSGLTDKSSAVDIQPGAEAVLISSVKKQGDIRFDIRQQGSSIDTYITEDISTLTDFKQQLEVQKNHRYIFTVR